MEKEFDVIQFTTKELRDCIEFGYLSPEVEWNPSKKIVLCPLEEAEQFCSSRGIILNENPNFENVGKSTFLRNPDRTDEFISSSEYRQKVISGREEARIDIFKKLGAREVYLQTYVKANASIRCGKNNGVKSDSKGSIKGVPFENNLEGNTTSKVNVNAEYKLFLPHSVHYTNDLYELTEDSWRQAKSTACLYGLYEDEHIKSILEGRKPGNCVLDVYTKVINIGGNVALNWNIAKSLSVLAKIEGIKSFNCGLNKLFDFETSANLEYETLVMINFKKEDCIEKEKEKYYKDKSNVF